MNSERQNKIFTFLLVMIAAILGAGAGVFGKIALLEIPPFSFTFLRFFIASAILLPFSLKQLKKFKREDYKIILLSLFASGNVVFFALGIRYTTVNTSAIIYSAVPIISAIFSYYFLKEKFDFKKKSGIAIGFAGVLLVILLPVIANSHSMGSIYGNVVITLAALSIALYWVLSKKFHNKYTTFEINNYFIFTTAGLMLFFSLFDLSQNSSWWQSISPKAYVSLFIVAILCTAVNYFIIQLLVKKASPTFASMTLFLQPVATFAMSYYLLSEVLTAVFTIGAVLSLFGVWLYNHSTK